MAADTSIEWTDKTWNPVRGCSRVSEGCRHCYAERVAARFSGPGKPYEGLADPKRAGSKWTGKVRLVESALEEPLRWRKPARIFVNSMSDLFHEALSDEDILRVFDIMREAHALGHTFQVLTKRAARMRDFCSRLDFDPGGLDGRPHRMSLRPRVERNRQGQAISFARLLKHVWLGVSVEDQKAADERIPHLLDTPAAVRFLSCEPLLGPVDLTQVAGFDCLDPNDTGYESGGRAGWVGGPTIDWVIIGGESGPGARPFALEWARALVEQCHRRQVPAFVKQLGAVPVMDESAWRALPTAPLLSARNRNVAPAGTVPLAQPDAKGGDWEAWPTDLRVRQFPEAHHG